MATPADTTLMDTAERLAHDLEGFEGADDIAFLAEDVRMMASIISAIQPIASLGAELLWLKEEYRHRINQLRSDVNSMCRCIASQSFTDGTITARAA